jgi:DegV family protein with EDD domain
MTYTVGSLRCSESFPEANGNYEMLMRSGGIVTTKSCGVSAYLSTFEELLRQGHDVLCVTFSSRLSNAYRSARTAAAELNTGRVLVFDSQTGAGAQEFLIRRARFLADNGVPFTALLQELEQCRSKCGICFSVDNMEPLRHSGREAPLRQSVGTILNLKPLLKLNDGAITFHRMAKGSEEQARALSGMIPSNATEITLHHFGRMDLLRSLLPAVRCRFPNVKVRVKPGGPVLTVHLGLNSIAAAWTTE